jgi:hypothetical protein
MKAQRGRRGIIILSLTSALDGVGGQRHALSALTPWKDTRYPLYRRLGRPQGRSGRVRKILPPPGFDPLTVQLVASRCTGYDVPVHWEGVALHSVKLCYLPDMYARVLGITGIRISSYKSRIEQWSTTHCVKVAFATYDRYTVHTVPRFIAPPTHLEDAPLVINITINSTWNMKFSYGMWSLVAW